MTLQACADILAQGDRDRFRATMAAPVAARRVLFPIYAFNVEVIRAPWLASEPPIAEIRLQWWRDVLAEIGAGQPPRAHEVAQPLAGVLDAEAAQILDALVAARRWDIYAAPFEDAAHFAEYLEATSAGLLWVAARALGAPAHYESQIRSFGWAMGMAGFLAAVAELRARGRQPLLSRQDQAVKSYSKEGLERLSLCDGLAKSLPSKVAPCLLAGWQSQALLRRAYARPERVREGNLALSEARKGLMLLWQSRWVRPAA
ncbi:MAG: squalene/phytoene synthase family protein [Mangrovicoccus sp.]|nr:squalene/phytoene synthase family protein [Mangrovicoccus sp.]